jgi:murein DD-endopeptidase MepM/ murein hydrolase activator NlpD
MKISLPGTIAFFLLLIVALAGCQTISPAPAGIPTAGSSVTPVPTRSPSPGEQLICQSYESSDYVLPYPVGTEYTVMQGFDGPMSHMGVFEYAVDFRMPIGSTVTAARGGQVVFIEESYSDEDVGIPKANVVVVQHEDGTYGRYIHLTQNGALVEMNQTVVQGDTIGLSGSSGYPPIPHLHFDVTKECPQSSCQTIPVCYRNTKPHLDGLVVGESYPAESYTNHPLP